MDAAERKARQDELKKAAAEKALEWLTPGQVVGVGSGSTVGFFIEALGRHRQDFPQAVSSSLRSTELLREAGIEVLDLNQIDEIGCYVDGADEVDPGFALIKGGGGALTREKIVAQASRHFVCIVDETKYVPVLGQFPLPVEVVPLARSMVSRQLVKLGGRPELRIGFRSAGGNEIVDVEGLDLSQPLSMEDEINRITGVIDNGLFAHRPADLLVLARESGVEVLKAQV